MAGSELQLHYHHPEHQATIHVSETSMPVVDLLHTSHIEELVCNDTTASITFSGNAAYNFALRHWQNAVPLALVHTFKACGNMEATHGWLIVESIHSTGLSQRSTGPRTIATAQDRLLIQM